MHDKTVLIIAYNFPPLGSTGVQRAARFAKYLCDYGWNVIVLSAGSEGQGVYDETLLDSFKDRPIEIARLSEFNSDADVVRVEKGLLRSGLAETVGHWLHIPDPAIKKHKRMVRLAEMIVTRRKVSVVMATAPPFSDFQTALDISQRHRLPFVVDYQEPWVDNPSRSFPTPFHKERQVRMEKSILTQAAKVIVSDRPTKELLLRRYRMLGHDDIRIVPHGYDPDDFTPTAGPAGIFNLVHCGFFHGSSSPKTLFKAVADFLSRKPEAKPSFRLTMVGVLKAQHTKLVKKLGLEGTIVLPGYLPHSEAMAELNAATALWLTGEASTRVPGKLFEYIGARKPIIASIPEGMTKRLADDTKAAFTCPPNDHKALSGLIENVFELWRSNKLPQASQQYSTVFDAQILTADLSRELAIVAKL